MERVFATRWSMGWGAGAMGSRRCWKGTHTQKYKTLVGHIQKNEPSCALSRPAITFFSSTRFRLYFPPPHPRPHFARRTTDSALPPYRCRAMYNKSSHSGNFLRGTSFFPQSNDLLNTSFLYSITVLFTFYGILYVRTCASMSLRIVSIRRLRNKKKQSPRTFERYEKKLFSTNETAAGCYGLHQTYRLFWK